MVLMTRFIAFGLQFSCEITPWAQSIIIVLCFNYKLLYRCLLVVLIINVAPRRCLEEEEATVLPLMNDWGHPRDAETWKGGRMRF